MDSQIPGESWQLAPAVQGLQQKLTGDVRQGLIVLMASVGAVLLLCVNLANLALARTAGRARESSIRTALGASRGSWRGNRWRKLRCCPLWEEASA